MKTVIVSSIAALLLPLVASAQDPSQVRRTLDALPVEERQQFEAAYEKALSDPAVVAATEDRNAAVQEHKDAQKAAVLAIDSSLEGVIDGSAKTPEERKKLKDAIAKVRSESNVRSSNTKRITAEKAYRNVLTEAILKADPTITPVMDKLNAKVPASPSVAPAEKAPAAQ